MSPCIGNQGCGATTKIGSVLATRNIRSRMNNPAPGCASLGNRLESTSSRGSVAALSTDHADNLVSAGALDDICWFMKASNISSDQSGALWSRTPF